jgi:benzoyl-CoA reductase/2-hydroxyglutaryl-CoA dehydratase subunit BcrC/BadD/HgdB
MTQPATVPSRREAIEAHRAAGGGVAAVFPVHYPRALLRAHDLLPVEVWGPPGRDTTAGDAHLQAYTCSIVRCGLSFLLDGGLDAVDALLVPHACDSLQGLGSVLLDFVTTRQPVLTFYLPRGRRASDREFMAAELRRLSEALGALSGRNPGAADLLAAAAREQRADAALAALLDARPRSALSNRAFYDLVRAREYLPAEDFEPLATAALDASETPPAGPGVVLSGLVPEPKAVLDTLDDAGLRVVADDMACCGRRVYPSGRSNDPYAHLAESLAAGPPDAMRGDPVEARLAHLLDLARRSGARGVIALGVKFCEPEQFYLPQLARGLQRAGLQLLALETDVAEPLSDQAVTRLEAFAESLR